MSFLLAAGVLLALVLALLVWAALRRPRAEHGDRVAGRLEAELDDDVAAGVLGAEDLSAAAADIDVTNWHEEKPVAQGKRRLWWVPLVLVTILGIALYWQIGNWRAGIHGDRAAVVHRAETMLAQLQVHLSSHPKDRSGWIALGRGKSAMGDYAAAAAAYAHAVRLGRARSPELLARWGEAMVLADPEHATDRERRIFSAVLRVDPDNIRGLWYGGLLALRAGDRELAIERWRQLVKQKIPPPMEALVRRRLAALGVQDALAGSPPK